MNTNATHTAARAPASAPLSAAIPELFAQHDLRVMEHARHRLPDALRLLQSFPGHLDNERVAACSPIDNRDTPDMVLVLVLHLLENREELAGDRELVIGVKPHLRHVDVT